MVRMKVEMLWLKPGAEPSGPEVESDLDVRRHVEGMTICFSSGSAADPMNLETQKL